MDFQDAWQKALKQTEILRSRVQGLKTSSDTTVPYVLLSESSINMGDTIVRKGEVVIKKPSLIVPPLNPQFEGFDFQDELNVDENSFINFLIVRGINLPSFNYDNKTSSLDVFEGRLSEAIKLYQDKLQRQENVVTGLLRGPEDLWQFSLLIYVCTQIIRNLDADLQKLLDDYQKRNKDRDV